MPDFHHMTFQRLGRLHHLRIADSRDLATVSELDEAHWVATGAPTEGLNCDPALLDFIDTDDNRRIMCFELIDAIEWLLDVLTDTAGVTEGSDALRLDAIDTDDEDGERIHRSASKMLARLGDAGSDAITLRQVREIKATEEALPVSEAGVVLPEAADDEVRQFLTDVIATVGGAEHPGGEKGLDQAHLDAFLDQAAAHLDWAARGRDSAEIMPLGAETADVFVLVSNVRAKLDQYFAQCEAAAFDPRAVGRFRPDEEQLAGMDFSDPQAIEQFIEGSPLAPPRADRTLDLGEKINPCYTERLAELNAKAIAPALGKPATSLRLDDWNAVKRFFAAHEQWSAAKPGRAVESLRPATLAKYLDAKFRKAAESLIADSTAQALAMDNIRLTEKAILYQAHLLDLANNFVSFPHLYDPSQRAMFELGTLVMDGRRFNFALLAGSRAEHSKVAAAGNMFIFYAEILPGGGAARYEIAVPVTSGGKGNLCVGMRGVFEDLSGRQSDARIVQIIENPISLGEAFVSPFKRIGKVLGGKIESITASAEKEFDSRTAGVLDGKGPAQPAPKAAPPNQGMLAGGMLMGGGVAIAALGSAVAFITKTLSDVAVWKIAVGIGVAVLAVVLPTSIVAVMKLRKRDLSSILAGAGWAINARMRLTGGQSRYFTQRPPYRKGAKGLRNVWPLVIALAILLAAVAVTGKLLGWY